MPITINGSGTVTGISAGGLPDDCITTADIAAGAVTQAKRSEQLTLGTAVASTSGTSIDFTGIPSWVKRVTVMLNGVSTSGTSFVMIQLGSTTFTTSGYAGTCGNNAANTAFSSGFVVSINSGASDSRHGSIQLLNHSGNTWSCAGTTGIITGNEPSSSAGTVTLSGTLDRVRITTVNGTDTFDAGSINIMYE